MIDWVKIRVQSFDFNSILEHSDLDFVEQVSRKTGEVSQNRIEARYKGLTFVLIERKHLELTGSLHKFFNAISSPSITNPEGYNWNEYSFSDLKETIQWLCNFLDLEPEQFRIHNIEIGVNINHPDLSPNLILNGLLQFSTKPWIDMPSGTNVIGKQAILGNYRVKFYDKGTQAKIPDPILRYEIKVRKMVHLQSIGINSFVDLLDLSKFRQLGKMLMDSVSKVHLYQTGIDCQALTPSSKKFYRDSRHPTYWNDLHKEKRNSYKRKRTRYNKLVANHTEESTHKKLLSAIEEKVSQLCTNGPKNRTILTAFARSYGMEKPYHFIPLYIGLKENYEHSRDKEERQRKCKVCKRDISHKRKDAKFCSKRCRNAESNPRHNPKNYRNRKYGSEPGPVLFPDLYK